MTWIFAYAVVLMGFCVYAGIMLKSEKYGMFAFTLLIAAMWLFGLGFSTYNMAMGWSVSVDELEQGEVYRLITCSDHLGYTEFIAEGPHDPRAYRLEGGKCPPEIFVPTKVEGKLHLIPDPNSMGLDGDS